jgi:hypothetical protein
MTKLQACLIASAAAVMALPQATAAQSAVDNRYCSALTGKFAGFLVTNNKVIQAIQQCRNGQSAEAIPVLEAALHDANVALPPRVQPALGLAKGPSR